MLIAINFHYIRNNFEFPYPSIFGVTPSQFAKQLEVLAEHGDFVGISDIIELTDKSDIPGKKIAITFDDGLKEQYELALPILKKKGIPAIFYANTKPIDEDFVTTTHKIHIIRSVTSPEKLMTVLSDLLNKHAIELSLPNPEVAQTVYKYDTAAAAQIKYFLNYQLTEFQQQMVVDNCFAMLDFDESQVSKDLYMTKNMLKDLAKLNMLGTHGHAHRPMGLLSENEAIADFDTSVQKLNEWTNTKIQTLSYPFGFKEACCTKVATRAQNQNIKFAFTMERAANKTLSQKPMFLARFGCNDAPGGKNCKDNFWQNIHFSQWYQ